MYTTYIDIIQHNLHRVIKTYKHSELIYKSIAIGYTTKQALNNHKRELKNMGYNCCGKNTIYINMT